MKMQDQFSYLIYVYPTDLQKSRIINHFQKGVDKSLSVY